MLRGDDVVDLQQRLSTLGFDTGRVDGIFGDRTSRALAEFQRNVGLPVDGIAGGATLRELIRLESRHEEPELISSVRARRPVARRPPDPQRPPRRHRRAGRAGQRDRRSPAPTRTRWHSGHRPAPPRRLDPGPPGQRTRASTSSSAFGSTQLAPNATPPIGPASTTSHRAAGFWPNSSRRSFPAFWGSRTEGHTACRWPSCARLGCHRSWSSWVRPAWSSSAPPSWPPLFPLPWANGRTLRGTKLRDCCVTNLTQR